MIRFDHVSKTYPGGTRAVEDFSLTVEQGSTTVFLGSLGDEREAARQLLALDCGERGEEALLLLLDDRAGLLEVRQALLCHRQDGRAPVMLVRGAVQQPVAVEAIHEARGRSQGDALTRRDLLNAARGGIADCAQDEEAAECERVSRLGKGGFNGAPSANFRVDQCREQRACICCHAHYLTRK